MSYGILRQVWVDGIGRFTQPTEEIYLIAIVVLNQLLFAIYVITITCIEMFGGNIAFQQSELNEFVGEGAFVNQLTQLQNRVEEGSFVL